MIKKKDVIGEKLLSMVDRGSEIVENCRTSFIDVSQSK